MAGIVKPAELEGAQHWCSNHLLLPAAGADLAQLPFSFCHDGVSSSSVLQSWRATRELPRHVDGATVETITFADPSGNLECCCVVTHYHQFPAVEWVVHFRNTGVEDSGILSDILPLDFLFPLDAPQPCVVHHARGALTQRDDFAPRETPLTFRQGGSQLELVARTGKSSTLHLPFFNLQMGNGGVIAAIGWSGGWAASFRREREGVRVRAGMERTHLRLHRGETIRTPRILLMFWQGSDAPDVAPLAQERVRSHNVWRRLLLAHYTPKQDGKPLTLPFCEGVWGAQPTASHLAKIEWLQENQIPTECYWIDAGWYGERSVTEAADALSSAWMRQVGSWIPNPAAYPDGFRPISEAARSANLGSLLWIEPERAFEGTQIVREHPEWLIGPVPSGNTNGFNFMVNLGIPEARRHVTGMVSDLLRSGGMTCYRQDFNDLRVPELFAMADAPDRVGMTEIQHITGLYAFWDELLARHPGLVIDNCAGGGQRMDLETMTRSVPLWRSDLQCWPFDPMAMQTQTQGLAPWFPLSAAVCEVPTVYAFRSALGAGLVTHWSSQALDGHADLPIERIRRMMLDAQALRDYFYGDFYPLLSFSLADDAWAAWQYDRPDQGDGLVVAFRRHASPFAEWQATLQGLVSEGTYLLTAWDTPAASDSDRSWQSSGKELMTAGFPVAIGERPGAALFTYRRVQ